MTGLSAALSYALSGLTVSAAQTAVASRNVTYAGDADYVRRTTALSTLPDGAAVLSATTRSVDARLQADQLRSSADAAGQTVTLDAYTELSATVGDLNDGQSLAAGISNLAIRLADHEAHPADRTLAAAAVGAADDVAQRLNDASATVQKVRQDADQAIARSVATINTLLQRFQTVNQEVINRSADDAARNDALDQRDSILKQLAQEIGIRTVTRAGHDMAIYSDGGVTLFETTARSLSFTPSPTLSPGGLGNAVYADGVRITGEASAMPSVAGRLQAQMAVRDTLTSQYQRQLDEVARGLIVSFAEDDQTGAGLAQATGLFSYPGSPAVPAAAVPGLAATITVHAAAAGNPFLLRDGGFGGAAYVANSSGAAGFQSHLSGLMTALSTSRAADPAAGLGASGTVDQLARSSAAWLEQGRNGADAAATTATARADRATEALQRVTGVNIDEEMARLLDLEKAYQASAKVMSVVNQMMQQLVAIV